MELTRVGPVPPARGPGGVGYGEAVDRSDTRTWVSDEAAEGVVGRLRVVVGPDEGLEHSFSERSIVVGSGPTAQLQLSDATVSRIHCELAREEGGVRLRDLGSKNGCGLAGSRVADVLLGRGARVRVGSTVLEADVARDTVRRTRWLGGDHFGELVGGSAVMHELFAAAARVAPTDERVLVRGESGTGKELLARALHEHSPRRQGPFVVVDCAALSGGVADVELFGHAQGAFTGAEEERAGAFERASGGTVFLDEIGELPLELQPKLLRVLDRGDVQRLGEPSRREVDVRVIAATHQPLERMVNDGSFREDLLFRLGGLELWVPPLRERGQDVLRIARNLAEDVGATGVEAQEKVDQAVLSRTGHPWPGNVRELRSFVRRVVALGDGAAMHQEVVAPSDQVRTDLPFQEAKRLHQLSFERRYMTQLLDESGGNLAEAARRAGVARTYMYELLARLGLPRP